MIGVFGGTFDPVHFGHLRPALEVVQKLNLDELRLIPTGHPPHRPTPWASAAQRVAMLEAAIRGVERFRLDLREVRKTTPSYTVETLHELRRENPDRPLLLLVGMDGFCSFHTWHKWTEIAELAHIVVMHRPGWETGGVEFNDELAKFVQTRRIANINELKDRNFGAIFFHPVTQLDISATQIREAVQRGEDIRFLLPGNVYQLIKDQKIYQ